MSIDRVQAEAADSRGQIRRGSRARSPAILKPTMLIGANPNWNGACTISRHYEPTNSLRRERRVVGLRRSDLPLPLAMEVRLPAAAAFDEPIRENPARVLRRR